MLFVLAAFIIVLGSTQSSHRDKQIVVLPKRFIKTFQTNVVVALTFLNIASKCDAVFIPDTQILRQPLNLKGLETLQTSFGVTTTSSSLKFVNKVIALVPILQLREEISNVKKELESINQILLSDSISKSTVTSILEKWKYISTILNKEKYNIKPLKLLFNSYADNIVVTVEQAKAGGEGTGMPSLLQTNQYLIRNSIITHLSDLRDDINSFDASDSTTDKQVDKVVRDLRENRLAEDALSDCMAVLDDFAQYVALADLDDYEQAMHALRK